MINNLSNKQKFDMSNITKFHNMGIKGQGVKIAVFESNSSEKNGHYIAVTEVVKMIAPDAQIDNYFSQSNTIGNDIMFKRFYDERYDLINVSFNGGMWTKSIYYPQLTRRCFIVASAGNSGKEEYFYPSAHDECLSVGATQDGKTIKSYSTTNDRLDIVNFTDVLTSDGFHFGGTSCSAPYTTGMIALYMQMFKKKFGRFPHINETTHYVMNNCIDLYEPGKDNKSGHGLFILSEDVYDMIWDSRKNELRKVSDWKREVEEEVKRRGK